METSQLSVASCVDESILLPTSRETDVDMDGVTQADHQLVLVGVAAEDDQLANSLHLLDLPVLHFSTGVEFLKQCEDEASLDETIFIVKEFEGESYEQLVQRHCRILGPPIVSQCARLQQPLPFTSRPLYCTAMFGVVLCFTGFRSKEELVLLITLVHHMGGSIRKDFTAKVTHLVAKGTEGGKYKVAVSLGTPIMREEWIRAAWERRNEENFAATDEEATFRMLPFYGCVLSFLGFSAEEQQHMEEQTEMHAHGGRYLPIGDEGCTHLVVENEVEEIPCLPHEPLFVVKREWFWGSIQIDARAEESMYLFQKPTSPSHFEHSFATPTSGGARKRRRRRDGVGRTSRVATLDLDLASGCLPSGTSPCMHTRKRPSTETSFSSLLDISNTPETSLLETTCNGRPSVGGKPANAPAKLSPRFQVSMELLQTESNYVEILTTIIELFKEPLEKERQVGGPILAPEEIKAIFGSIPEILEVHTHMRVDLQEVMANWREESSIGEVIIKHSERLLKTYPSFINFFEMSKETVITCEKQKPRFHAFLKINQGKPQCGRQTLVELLIRPVQRLPSIGLLLNDIKKHTPEGNPDKKTLETAIKCLREVMMQINEDKRKTEGQRQIFDIVYEVDGCPANLLSSQRSLVAQEEMVALGDKLCDHGESITMFLFTDCLEIARKKHRAKGGFKSPHSVHMRPSLKHLLLMQLSHIRNVVDIQETDECRNAFGLMARSPDNVDHQLFTFGLVGEETTKDAWLQKLSRQVANTICKPDSETLIHCMDPDTIDVTTRVTDSTLSRASRVIKKTSKKVTRAFSFGKTPKRSSQRGAPFSPLMDEVLQASPFHERTLGRRLTSTLTLTVRVEPQPPFPIMSPLNVVLFYSFF
uniref:protein ECT2-like isoform X1 n=1 Tax=Myxine glutinosa TaxID=7769 RepID=UPI00358E3946